MHTPQLTNAGHINRSVFIGDLLMPLNWREHIVSIPELLRGKPRIKGTRILISLILGYFAAGYTTEEITVEFPDLEKVQIYACLDYARDLAEFEEVA